MTIPTKKYFTRKNDNDIITSRTDLNLIERKNKTVWIMNHLFLNPEQHDQHEISLIMHDVVVFVQESEKKIWPLDPIAIKYFKQHPELEAIWYNKPFNF